MSDIVLFSAEELPQLRLPCLWCPGHFCWWLLSAMPPVQETVRSHMAGNEKTDKRSEENLLHLCFKTLKLPHISKKVPWLGSAAWYLTRSAPCIHWIHHYGSWVIPWHHFFMCCLPWGLDTFHLCAVSQTQLHKQPDLCNLSGSTDHWS